jgi:hypothetical protein
MPSDTSIADLYPVRSEPHTKRVFEAELVALLAIGWPFFTLVLSTLLFSIDIPISSYHLWGSLLISLVVGRYFASDWWSFITAIVCLAFVTLAGSTILGWLYDFSGDGQWYHLPGILALAEGWNPFIAPQLGKWDTGFEQDLTNAAIYVQHYAKGVWIVAAAAYKATGLLEATKVFNLLYLVAVYLLTLSFLGRIGLSRMWVHTLALTAAANPVILYQVPSFFVDGQLASLCTLLFVLSLDYFHQPRRRTLFLLAACVMLLINVKFTGLVYAVTIGGCFTALAFLKGWKGEGRRYALMGAISILLGSMVFGFQPYVTNVMLKGNPFYPAVGQDEAATAATEGQFELWAPPEFLSMSRIEKLTRSVLAESSAAKSMPQWKLPFKVNKNELYIFFNTEPRYGGFGPFFGSILLAVLVLYVLAIRATNSKWWKAGAVLSILVILSILPNPEAWWARLAPQLWLVPIILITALALGASNWPRKVSAALLLMLLANSMLVAGLNWGRATEKNLAYREQLSELQKISSPGPLELFTDPRFRMVTQHRLSTNSIPYRLQDKLSCAQPFRFSYPNQPARAQAAACPFPRVTQEQ